MASLEERVQRLEDIEEIRRLKQVYAKLCDNDYEPVGLSNLFTENATWDADELGFHLKGKQEIHDFFAEVSGSYTFALHYTLGHIIDVDSNGTDAQGTWYIWMPATVNGHATFFAATYEDTYKKVDGRWLCDTVRIHLGFFTTYEKGWVQERMAEV